MAAEQPTTENLLLELTFSLTNSHPRWEMQQIASSEARKRFRFLNNLPFVVPHEGLFSDSCGTFPYIFEILVKIREILVKIREIFEPISGIVRKIYGVFKAIFGIACKIERVLKEMRGVSMPISRIAWKTREIRTMIWGNRVECAKIAAQ